MQLAPLQLGEPTATAAATAALGESQYHKAE
jgi:hypothetical protein